MKKVGIKDVAAEAGVSLGTVSNVLNRPHLVTEGKRDHVLAVIKELGFVRNESARQLRAGTSRTVGLVLLDVGNPFFTDVARGVEDAASQAGATVILCNTDEQRVKERRYLDVLAQQRVMGVLITPVRVADPALKDLRARGIPVVIVDRPAPARTCCSVSVDDVLGGRLGAGHLVEQGHRRIAFVGGPTVVGQVRDRLAGARSAVAAAGLPETALTHIDTKGLTFAGGRDGVAQLMALPKSRRPTGLFFANDLLALGALQELTRRGIGVPSEFALVGYDDIDYAEAAAVPLSSVRQPAYELGKRAMEQLLDETGNDEHVHRKVVFTPELVARESSAGRSSASSSKAKSVSAKSSSARGSIAQVIVEDRSGSRGRDSRQA